MELGLKPHPKLMVVLQKTKQKLLKICNCHRLRPK